MDVLPTSLQEAILYFSDADHCLQYAITRRWPDGVCCPTCNSREVKYLSTRRLWECKNTHARKQFSFKAGTIFEDSALGLDKWFIAMWLIANAKNGISSHELGRAIKVTQKSAWHMLHRIRLAMQVGSIMKIEGQAEADETFIGGKSKNMHASVRERRISGTGGKDKIMVMGVLERGGEVRAAVLTDRNSKALQGYIRAHVSPGSLVYTDALRAYHGLSAEYVHAVVDHAVEYVRGNVHTNGIENFWSLLKRGIGGTYVAVEPPHLFRYVSEQVFRFNMRKLSNDGARFHQAMTQIIGKKLTYAELTGKTGEVRH